MIHQLVDKTAQTIMRLMDFAANVYSQSGEGGILAKMLELLPVKDRWSVEFGRPDRHVSLSVQPT